MTSPEFLAAGIPFRVTFIPQVEVGVLPIPRILRERSVASL